jgi:hypothetical protein
VRGFLGLLHQHQVVVVDLAAEQAPQVAQQDRRAEHGKHHARGVEPAHRDLHHRAGRVPVDDRLVVRALEQQPQAVQHQQQRQAHADLLAQRTELAHQHVGAQVGIAAQGGHRAQEGQPDEQPAREFFRNAEARVEGVAHEDVAEHQHHHERQQRGNQVADELAVAIDQLFQHESVSRSGTGTVMYELVSFAKSVETRPSMRHPSAAMRGLTGARSAPPSR